MFKCAQCGQSGLRPTKIVVERKMVKHFLSDIPKGPRGGIGSQIVREIQVCDTCSGKTVEAPLEHAELVPVAPKKDDFSADGAT